MLFNLYETLQDYFGDLHWWPADSAMEVVVGTILTQNTAWRNVEKAIHRLKVENLLHPAALYHLDERQLAELIRPAGYFRVKTKRLKAFVSLLHDEYQNDLGAMFALDLWTLRNKLLSVHGIGEETADSILLYAAGKPVFVVDAYTRRIMQRHHLIGENAIYAEIQALIMKALPASVPLYNQYHALLVNAGKMFCRKQTPKCDICPLYPFL
jgi:endonuclease-3 related protein